MKSPKFKYSKKFNTLTIGVDEAGRGAWAGPVVASCVAWEGKCPFSKMSLRDSKKMTVNHREHTFKELQNLAEQGRIQCGVGIIDNAVIDIVGIREANRRAMEWALQEILQAKDKEQKTQKHKTENTKHSGIIILIDGRDNYSFDLSNLPKPEYIVRGDSIVPQIMAASILAKVTRDSLMREFEHIYPRYGFSQHKGYGTALHETTLAQFGPCDIHRKSFKPVKFLES